jgi:signal transduction histidine kinase
VTTSRGVAYVPPAARYTPPQPPRVALVDARVDDEQVFFSSDLEIPHERNRLELRFAALSYRDPLLIRYQVRLAKDEPWLNTSEASFRWIDLSSGAYSAQVRASLDGETWSAAPAGFAFRVAPPWYWEPWAIALYAASLALVLYLAYRVRVAHLVRLERQRTRIAMDLHDDIGSGLGSIGILSGILARDGVEDPERREMAREIAGTAQELGSALSHIVWALDPRARTLEELTARLADHGRRLFAGDTTSFTTPFPQRRPTIQLAQPVRRNLLFIGLEALHNAARHAHASHVELIVAPRSDDVWELAVADDGVGMARDPESESTSGMGLRSMRRRAEEIGGEVRWSASPDGGTMVSLVFRPRGTGRRIARLLERRARP